MGTLERISCWIATLGPIGYLPAPGTWGTLCAVPVMYALRSFYTESTVIAIVACLMLIAFLCVHYGLPRFRGDKDPSEIVVDEFIGFSAVASMLPLTPLFFGAGFLAFRLFDIFKPLGIKSVEALPGTLGIMLDDVVAALYAGILVWSLVIVLK